PKGRHSGRVRAKGDVPALGAGVPSSVKWFVKYGLGKGENQARALGEQCPSGSLWRVADQAVRSVPQWLRGRGDRVRICYLNVGMELGRRRVQRQNGIGA